MIDANQLRKILPQAYPFLLIDRVIDFEEGKRLTAIKNITANEWSVLGDAGGAGYFPETLIIEAAAQAALMLYKLSKVKNDGRKRRYILGKINAAIFRKVMIGEQLVLKALANKMLDTGGYSEIRAISNSRNVAEIEIIYSVKMY